MALRLADFGDAAEPARWWPTDDVVMGGKSSSALRPSARTGVFEGELSLENGGGFASVRRLDEAIDLG
ncbi:MAG: CIA30 family protein [Archangium sp.]|nr:CIA30 family protein [Archangium sp.]